MAPGVRSATLKVVGRAELSEADRSPLPEQAAEASVARTTKMWKTVENRPIRRLLSALKSC